MKFPIRFTQLVKSYTHNRTYYIHANQQSSTTRHITAGVAQGSALRPVLFSLYINSIPTLTDSRISNVLYADDTAIATTSHGTNIIAKLLQNHLDQLDEYFKNSGLRVNVDKCQAILFTPKKHIPLPKLSLSDRELGWAKEITYLGVTLDRTLTFRKHIKNVNSKAIGKIKSIQHLIHRAITPKSRLSFIPV